MNRFFESPVFAFLSRAADLAILNCLWFVCCIPVVTAGASTAALYYCTLKMHRNEDSGVWKMFFHSFKQNLKQGIALTLIYLLAGGLVLADLYIGTMMANVFAELLKGVMILFGVILIMMVSYSFPLLAQFENSVMGNIRSAFVMSLGQLPRTLLIMVLNLLPGIVWLCSPRFFIYTLFFWMMFGTAVIAWVNSALFVKIFQKYMPEKEA